MNYGSEFNFRGVDSRRCAGVQRCLRRVIHQNAVPFGHAERGCIALFQGRYRLPTLTRFGHAGGGNSSRNIAADIQQGRVYERQRALCRA